MLNRAWQLILYLACLPRIVFALLQSTIRNDGDAGVALRWLRSVHSIPNVFGAKSLRPPSVGDSARSELRPETWRAGGWAPLRGKQPS